MLGVERLDGIMEMLKDGQAVSIPVSYTHLRAHAT